MSNMKYKVGGVQQEKVLELNKQIHEKFEVVILKTIDEKEKKKLVAKYNEHLFDLKDAYILTYLKDIFSSRKMITKEVEGKIFKWVDYNRLLTYLPLLGINNQKVLSRRFQKYEEYGLITRHVHKKYNKATMEFGGSYTFLHLQDSFYDLFEEYKLDETDEEVAKLAKEMGLNFNLPEVTEKFPVGGHSKVPCIEVTEKFPHNTTIYSNNYTTTEKSKSSSSISQEIKDLLETEIQDKGTIENLIDVITTNNIDFERVKSVITYSKKSDKGFGYIYKSLKMNWPVPVEKVIKNKKIEKTMEYIQKQTEEKREISENVTTINLTEIEENKAIEILVNQGINKNYLANMKKKNNKIYLSTLNSALRNTI